MNVGEKMILLGTSAGPKAVTVTEVTPAHWLKISELKGAFRPTNFLCEYQRNGASERLVAFTEEKLAKYLSDRADMQRRHDERREEEETRQREIAERKANELAEIKEVMNDRLDIRHYQILPDGSRLVTMALPTRIQFQKEFEFVVVRLWDDEDYNWRGGCESTVPVTRFAATFVTSKKGSFSSCSEQKAADEDSALWEIARDRFNDNW
jgi:hypothetical protein